MQYFQAAYNWIQSDASDNPSGAAPPKKGLVRTLDKWYVVIQDLLEVYHFIFCYYHILCVHAILTYRVDRLYDQPSPGLMNSALKNLGWDLGNSLSFWSDVRPKHLPKSAIIVSSLNLA